MAGIGKPLDSLRVNRSEGERLIFILLLSLAAHLIAFGGYEYGKEMHLFSWLPHHAKKNAAIAQVVQNSEEPLEFVTVNQPSTEAPQKTKYYSSQNSIAANPDANRDTDKPKLDGKQTDAPMTENIVHPQFSKSATGADKQDANDQQENKEQKPALSAGDLTLGKPIDSQQDRPRTLNQAYAMRGSRLPSVMMQQDGGVRRHAAVPAFDVQVTGFGEYDERFVTAVTQRWFGLLDSQNFALDRSGKVVLLFRLNYDGSISDMSFAENTVGDVLGYVCQKAVLDSAPFEHWPSDMRLKLGDYCDVRFTFFYY